MKYKQLCWRCSKACNANMCPWVLTLKHTPNGCVIDKDGYIISCPLFKQEKQIVSTQKAKCNGKLSQRYIANFFDISYWTVVQYAKTRRQNSINMSLFDFVQQEVIKKAKRKKMIKEIGYYAFTKFKNIK